MQQHREPGGALHKRADRGALEPEDQSGSPDALLRRGPLRTVRAALTAHGSSKPLGLADGQKCGLCAFGGFVSSKAVHVCETGSNIVRCAVALADDVTPGDRFPDGAYPVPCQNCPHGQ